MKLDELDKRTIAVELEIGGICRIIRGTGVFERAPGSRSVLRIEVTEATGDFALILDEARWQGSILVDGESGCEYRIRLRAQDFHVRA